MSRLKREGVVQFRYEHHQTQELLGRYAEIEILRGGAALTYPEVAAHLERCELCRSQLADLKSFLNEHPHGAQSSRAAALRGLASGSQGRAAPSVPPLDLLFSVNFILPIDQVLASAIGHADPYDRSAASAAIDFKGVLLYYDMLRIGKIALVVLFTLFRDQASGRFRIEGIITPDQAPFHYKAQLKLAHQSHAAEVRANRLEFHHLALSPDVKEATVLLEGFARWRGEGH
jgi:hypothetical protein